MSAVRAIAAVLLLCACATSAPRSVHVLIAGDSTASAYGPERYPRMGWGMVLACGFPGSVAVDNRAVSGRSTKSYLDEGHWDRLLAATQARDVVLIQFGHNDEKTEDPRRYTPARGAFVDNLTRFVSDVRTKGATPVLVTPVARRRFADGMAMDTHGEYDDAVRDTARSTGAALIDLGADSMALLTREGEEGSRRLYLHFTAADGVAAYPDGVSDDTHFSEAGARAIARLVVSRLAEIRSPVGRAAHADAPALRPGFHAGGPACARPQNVPG